MAQKVFITPENEKQHKVVQEVMEHIVVDKLSHAPFGRLVLVPTGQTFLPRQDPRGSDKPSAVYEHDKLGNFQAFVRKH